MLRIIVSRLLQGVAVMIGATLIVFLASYLTGDPAALMMGDTATCLLYTSPSPRDCS